MTRTSSRLDAALRLLLGKKNDTPTEFERTQTMADRLTGLRRGMVLRHHSGRIYTVLDIANQGSTRPAFPEVVNYLSADGVVCRLRLDEFTDEKFTILFDGTNLTGTPRLGDGTGLSCVIRFSKRAAA